MKTNKWLLVTTIAILNLPILAAADDCRQPIGGSEHSVGLPGPEADSAVEAYLASPMIQAQKALLERHEFCLASRSVRVKEQQPHTFRVWEVYSSSVHSNRFVSGTYSAHAPGREMFFAEELNVSGIGHRVSLNTADSELVMNALIDSGLESPNVGVGADVRNLGQLACSQPVVPNPVPSCTLIQGEQVIEASGAQAADLMRVLTRNRAYTGPKNIVGALNVGAVLVECSRVVYPGAVASCTMVIENRE